MSDFLNPAPEFENNPYKESLLKDVRKALEAARRRSTEWSKFSTFSKTISLGDDIPESYKRLLAGASATGEELSRAWEESTASLVRIIEAHGENPTHEQINELRNDISQASRILEVLSKNVIAQVKELRDAFPNKFDELSYRFDLLQDIEKILQSIDSEKFQDAIKGNEVKQNLKEQYRAYWQKTLDLLEQTPGEFPQAELKIIHKESSLLIQTLNDKLPRDSQIILELPELPASIAKDAK